MTLCGPCQERDPGAFSGWGAFSLVLPPGRNSCTLRFCPCERHRLRPRHRRARPWRLPPAVLRRMEQDSGRNRCLTVPADEGGDSTLLCGFGRVRGGRKHIGSRYGPTSSLALAGQGGLRWCQGGGEPGGGSALRHLDRSTNR